MANNRPERYTNLIHARVPQDGARTVTDYRFFYDDPRRYGLTVDPSGIGVPTPAEVAAGVTPVNYAYEPYNGLRYGMVGDDATDNTAALANLRAVAAQGVECFIPAGTYRYDTSPNWGIPGLHLTGERGTILKHMAPANGVAFNVDSGTPGTWVYGLVIEQLIIQGTTNGLGHTTDGVYAAGLAGGSIIRNVEVRSVDSKAFNIKGCVSSYFDNCQVNRSIGGSAFSPVPDYGFFLDEYGSGDFTANCTFTNCVAENFDGGTTGVGARYEKASGNTWRGGSFETLATGLSLSASARHNIFESLWFEGNSTNDTVDNGQETKLDNCFLSSASSGNNLEAVGDNLTMIGGYTRVANLQAGSESSLFVGVAFDNSPGNGIIGSGTFRSLGCTLVDSTLEVTGTITDKLGINGSFTGTLTGCTTSPTGSISYTVNGDLVTLVIPQINATSNSTAATVTGMPAAIRPTTTQQFLGIVQDNGTIKLAILALGSAGTLVLSNGTSATFTSSGAKGIDPCTVSYRLG